MPRRLQQVCQERRDSHTTLFDQYAQGGLAHPSVRMFQRGRELCGRRPGEINSFQRSRVFVLHTPDTPVRHGAEQPAERPCTASISGGS